MSAIAVSEHDRDRLAALAGDRRLVIDHYASRRCGATIGDLRARFVEREPPTDVVELEPIGSVRLFAESALIPLLDGGASLGIGGFLGADRPRVSLDRPETWLAFLEAHPARRR